MGYLISLFSLSESATSAALDISEGALCISGLLLLFGAIGEYLFDHNKLPRWMNWPKLTFEIIVAVSLCGELLADGSVAVLSHRLQNLEGNDIQALDSKARIAGEKATAALGTSSAAFTKAQAAEDASGRAVDKSGKAETTASRAITLANKARQELGETAEEQRRINGSVLNHLLDRHVDPRIRDSLKVLPPATAEVQVVPTDGEAVVFAVELVDALIDAHWKVAPLSAAIDAREACMICNKSLEGMLPMGPPRDLLMTEEFLRLAGKGEPDRRLAILIVGLNVRYFKRDEHLAEGEFRIVIGKNAFQNGMPLPER
jgi:hypothetical protein